MTLYQQLQNEFKNHRDFWNYYGMGSDDVLGNERKARKFIYEYFKSGSKQYVLGAGTNFEKEYINTRNVHTVNVFFIGAYLQRMIDEYLAIESEVSSSYPFSYLWYLLSLAHDFGYKYEDDSEVYLNMPERLDYRRSCQRDTKGASIFMPREYWYREHGINVLHTYPPYGEKSRWRYHVPRGMREYNGNIVYSNGTVIDKQRYSRKTINNYFYYRLNKMGTLDHGIVGADDFFSKMKINYMNEYRKVAKHDFFRGNLNEFHNEQGLHFCSEQFKIFTYIADCIASHNVYKAGVMTRDDYEKYDLNSLVGNRFKPISYEDNPLLFILCVADTIEPSKRFENYSNERLLNLLSIYYHVGKKSLHIVMDEELYDSAAGRKYVARVEGLKHWCDIKTVVERVRFSDRVK